MCLSPTLIRNHKTGQSEEVACLVCAMCRRRRINDLVGRSIAEQCTAKRSFSVTLTYSGDGPESAVLRYRDVQLFMKRLRKAGFKVRYIVAGEYGTKKGRAHWHIILFFYENAPNIQIGSRINWEYWPHGFCYFQNPDFKGFYYALKYALKQDGNEGASKALMMSKKPPLGHAFFMRMADDIVERYLPIHSGVYSFADVIGPDGKPRKFFLRGRMLELFLDRYYIMWRMLYKKDPPWSDFLLEYYLDPIERKRMDDDPARIERDHSVKAAEYKRRMETARSEAFWLEEQERKPIGYLVFTGNRDLVLAFSDDTAELFIKDQTWQVTVGSVSVAEQLGRTNLPKSKIKPVLAWLESEWMSHRDRLQKRSLN